MLLRNWLAMRSQTLQIKFNRLFDVRFGFLKRLALRMTTRQRRYRSDVAAFGIFFIEDGKRNVFRASLCHSFIVMLRSQLDACGPRDIGGGACGDSVARFATSIDSII